MKKIISKIKNIKLSIRAKATIRFIVGVIIALAIYKVSPIITDALKNLANYIIMEEDLKITTGVMTILSMICYTLFCMIRIDDK